MGVLAKAWLAKFVPFTTGREAEDAYARYKLDQEADSWHLEGVITLVPFLVQVAAFLFLGGLIVQNIADDQTLGNVLLGFCISGCAIYIIMTGLPLLFPSSPFNTPLTEVLPRLGKMLIALLPGLGKMLGALPRLGQGLKALFTGTPPSKSDPTAHLNKGLAKILHTKLIKSPKPTHIDEAATEIAHPNFNPKSIRHLCRTDTPSHLLERFKTCASTRTSDAARNNEILCSYLLAFLKFVGALQDKLVDSMTKDVDRELGDYQDLLHALRTSLTSGYPLHRWNALPKPPRQLSLSLRTQIVCLLEALPAEYRTSQDPALPGLRFQPNEMLDRLWELALQDIQSTHRLHFMLAACRGVLQGKTSVKTTGLYILSLCLAKAGCSASETGRTSEWAGSILAGERHSVQELALKLLPQLYTVTITEVQHIATEALNKISSLSPEPEISAAQAHRLERQDILETLVSALGHTGSPIDPLKMLSQVPDLKSDLFNPTSIKTVSDKTVFGAEDARKDGLQVLTNLVTSSRETLGAVTESLHASVISGFESHEQQQRLRTIAFVRAMWKNPHSLFYQLVREVIPTLVEVALNADSTDVRRPALRLAKDMWTEGSFALLIRGAVPTALKNGLDYLENKKRHRVLTDLLEHLKDDESKVASRKPHYDFAWEDNVDLARDIFPVVFDKIVTVAIHDDSDLIRGQAFCLLKELSKNYHVNGDHANGSLRVDALAWLEAATGPSVLRIRAVRVLETFIDQLDLTNVDLLNKIIEWAVADEHNDVRRTSVSLILTICKEQNLTMEMLDMVKSAVLSVKDKILSEGDSNVRALWVQFLNDMEQRVPFKFPEIVPIFAKLYIQTENETNLLKSPHGNLLLVENDPEHIKAFESALPQDLSVSFHDSRDHWSTTARWVKLLVLLSRRGTLSETAERNLERISKDVRYEINDKSSFGAQVEANKSESTLTLPLRRRLYQIGPDDRRTWVDILATIAAFYPFGFKDVPNILFQMAMHDPDPAVQSECLQHLTQLSEHVLLRVSPDLTRTLVRDTVDHFDDFVKSADQRVRISHMQLLSAFKLHYSENVELLEELLIKLSNATLSDSNDDYRFEAVKTFSNLTELDDRHDHSNRERCHHFVDPMVKERCFGAVVGDETERVRRLWVKLATQIRDTSKFTKIFDAAVKDSSSIVQSEGMGALQRLLIEAEFREPLAKGLGEALVSSLRTPKHTDRAVMVLTTVTAPPKPEKTEGSEERHQLWIQIILLLSRNVEFQALPKLIETVIKGKTSDAAFESEDTLCSLFQNVELRDQIDNVLPKVIESALKPNVAAIFRLAAISLFGKIIGCDHDHGESQSRYEAFFLGRNSDSQIMSRLADIVIKDGDGDMRIAALQVLKLACPLIRFREANKIAFCKIIETLLNEQGNKMHHSNARSALDTLVLFRDIASFSISQLLRTDGGQDLANSAGRALFDNPPVFAGDVAGKVKMQRLIETLPVVDDTAIIVVHTLMPMLQSASLLARATAVELLLRLYTKHGHPNPGIFEPAIHEIIALALNDHDGVKEVRITAIQLLVALSSGPTSSVVLDPENPAVVAHVELLRRLTSDGAYTRIFGMTAH
ncbi:hypothetical protein EST38_g12698 [Candolleomyces aberdarensis]|uniref:DUF6535 domain-containing protein n=1 Tax=Candolleomyces aberdarensis TaxID=2316362 RepID=A0A4Q2D1R3_9AGAR|nr:hypothetical protein EST38_g12698 [Candolleomyces aberdarensis]